MSKEPQAARQIEQIPSVEMGVSAMASANAPFIFVESVPTFGVRDGIVNLTLESIRHHNVGGNTLADRVVVAHLRLTLPAFAHLKAALQKIDLMIAKPDDGNVN